MVWIPATVLIWMAAGLVLLRFVFSFWEIVGLLSRWWRSAEDKLHEHQSYKIPMYNDSVQENHLYRKATTYIGTLPSLEDSNNALLFSKKPNNSCFDLYLQLDVGQTVHDNFLGARISWTNHGGDTLVLKVRKQDRRRVLRPYLQHIESVADEELRRREVRLFTNSTVLGGGGERRRWKAVPFTHPSTMETLAMDIDLKNRVMSDLESFLKNKQYYHRLGRVWKRSYLLYGPPGTGKSSFVAAMAKFLCYDVFDLDLGRVSDGSDLKTLLLQTSARSVIVVEDLDHYLQTTSQSAGTVGSLTNTLCGVLNFMDGIFSCCGEERVMVFTMRDTGVSGIDPAVMRPGRLDVQLYFPLCDFTSFKTMASSYLGLKDHKLYPAVQEIFQSGASMSQAEIGEIMIANKASPSRALKTVINALQQATTARRVGGFFGNVIIPKKKASSWVGNGGSGGDGGLREEETGEGTSDGVLGSNGSLNKEFKKLYGLIRRGGSKKDGQSSTLTTSPVPTSMSNHRKQLSSSSLDLPPASLSDNSKESPASS